VISVRSGTPAECDAAGDLRGRSTWWAKTPKKPEDYVLARALAHAATTNWVVDTNPFEGGSDHTPFLRANKPGTARHTRVACRCCAGTPRMRSASCMKCSPPPSRGWRRNASSPRLILPQRPLQIRAQETNILHTWTQYYVDVLATIRDVPTDTTRTSLNALIASAQASIREAGALPLRAIAAPDSSEAR